MRRRESGHAPSVFQSWVCHSFQITLFHQLAPDDTQPPMPPITILKPTQHTINTGHTEQCLLVWHQHHVNLLPANCLQPLSTPVATREWQSKQMARSIPTAQSTPALLSNLS